MFRVIIVDDEPLCIRSLKTMIESCDSNFKVVDVAYDGETGFAKIIKQKPDLVFMDISMPLMDGLCVVEKLRQEGNDTHIVILSGYQEFDYAKKAIKLGVMDYLVKPLNPAHLKKFIEEIREQVEREQRRKRVVTLKKLFNSGGNFQNDEQFDTRHEKLCMAKICFNPFHFIRNNQFVGDANKRDTIVLQESCEKLLKNRMMYWLLNGKYDNEFLLVAECEENFFIRRMKALYEEMQKELSKDHTITFVVAQKAESYEKLREVLAQLESILYCNTVYSKNNWLTNEDKEKASEEQIPEIDYDYGMRLVEKGKVTVLKTYLNQFFEACEVKQCTQAGLIQVLRKLMQACRDENVYDTDFILNLIMTSSHTYKELEEKVYETLIDYVASSNDEQNASVEYTIERVAEYLDNHYQEKLLIQDVAEMFGFNYSYLCKQFKTVKKISPNEYMIVKRMERAKELLCKCREVSIKEIAELVGYTDQYYFSRIFKLYEKCTPSEYRKMNER